MIKFCSKILCIKNLITNLSDKNEKFTILYKITDSTKLARDLMVTGYRRQGLRMVYGLGYNVFGLRMSMETGFAFFLTPET